VFHCLREAERVAERRDVCGPVRPEAGDLRAKVDEHGPVFAEARQRELDHPRCPPQLVAALGGRALNFRYSLTLARCIGTLRAQFLRRRCIRSVFLVAAGAALFGAGGNEEARAQSGRAVARVADLVGQPLVLKPGQTARSLKFRLPPNTEQGPERWYMIHLDYVLRVSRSSGPGFVWVSASTNGRTAAQIEYTLRKRRERLQIRESQLDLVNGGRRRLLRGRVAIVEFKNYLQYEGVRGGENTLRVAFKSVGMARVDQLEVLPTSGVFLTRRSPYPVKVHASMTTEQVAVGDRFSVELVLSNRTGERIRDVKVRPVYDQRIFKLHGRDVHRWSFLNRPRRVLFCFEALRAGTADLRFLVDSSRNRPSATIRLGVRPSTGGSASGIVWALLFAPLAAGIGYLLWPRREAKPT